MSVIDKLSSISETLSSVFQFAQEQPEIKEDFEEYLKTIGAYNAPQSQLNSILVTYVFERMFHKGADSVFSMFLKENHAHRRLNRSRFPGRAKCDSFNNFPQPAPPSIRLSPPKGYHSRQRSGADRREGAFRRQNFPLRTARN